MDMFSATIVLCTAPDEIIAQDIATKALTDRLAACVTILPGAKSFYYWKDKLEQSYEVQMLLKTNLTNQQDLLYFIKSFHPYETPELLVLPVIKCDNEYLSWLNAHLS